MPNSSLRFRSPAAALLVAALVLTPPVNGQSSDVPAEQPNPPQTPQTAQPAASPVGVPPLPDLRIPENASGQTLQEIVERAKAIQPANSDQYKAMQSAIREASRQLLRKWKGRESSREYQQAEIDAISASVMLMTFADNGAQQRTVAQVQEYLKGKESLTMADLQTGIMAAAMLELQPNKQPARDTYELLDTLLKDDARQEMQALRLNLQSNIRRLDMLGHKFELSATTVAGTPISIDDLAGNFVVVDFFATWCKPCLDEVPRLKRHYQRYHERGLEVLAISIDAERETLDAYLSKAELPWPVIHDASEDPLDSLQMRFGISQLPTVLLLNKEGTVVSLEARGAELDRLMEMLFEAPTPAPANDEALDANKEPTAPGDKAADTANAPTPATPD